MKKLHFKFTILIISIFTMVNCCKKESETPSTKEPLKDKINVDTTKISKNLNISILIDLSDRISPEKYPNPSMEYYQRDLGYIETISKSFETALSKKPIRQTNDQMQVFFEPEPEDTEINSLAKNLKVSFTKDNTTKKSIGEIAPIFKKNSEKIYNIAVQNKQFVGSDIWKFFKNKVKDYCIKDNHRNILIILTDGYIYHKDSKFMEGNKSSYLTPELIKSFGLGSDFEKTFEEKKLGLIPANSNLENLEVIVLGINPSKNNPFEGDIIKLYWADWLKKMGVKKFYLKEADLPSNLEPVIQKIISGK